MITNEFRKERMYGRGTISDAQRLDAMRKVYAKFPLPIQNMAIPTIEPVPFPVYKFGTPPLPSRIQYLPTDIPQNNIIRSRWYNK